MEDVAEREAEAERLEAEMAEVCGILHATTARLVALIGRVLETEAWQGFGIRSAQQWVAWRFGVSPHRAHTLVAMAQRLGELPETRAAFDAGELGEDSVGLICRLACCGGRRCGRAGPQHHGHPASASAERVHPAGGPG